MMIATLLLVISVVGLLIMGLGNNNCLGRWLQPQYTKVMDRLQERQDARRARSSDAISSRFAAFVVNAIVLVIVLLMFGAGELIWPDRESSGLARLALLAIFVYVAYQVGKQAGKV